ncbi:MAG: hypothetical protein DRN07_08235 [Thermoplasmata archaeon]|nr:MAG: hypothetical protein DRN07_08235 [Thermoplasmata archaeon]
MICLWRPVSWGQLSGNERIINCSFLKIRRVDMSKDEKKNESTLLKERKRKEFVEPKLTKCKEPLDKVTKLFPTS